MEQFTSIAATLKKQSTTARSNLFIQDEKWSFNHHLLLSTPFVMGENDMHYILNASRFVMLN
jgi:hypothetical protein